MEYTVYRESFTEKVHELSISVFLFAIFCIALNLCQPFLFGQDLDWKVRDYLHALREVVNISIVIGTATGIIRRHDSNLLAVNGGYIVLTKPWAQYLLERMGYVKRKATSTAKVIGDDLASLKK